MKVIGDRKIENESGNKNPALAGYEKVVIMSECNPAVDLNCYQIPNDIKDKVIAEVEKLAKVKYVQSHDTYGPHLIGADALYETDIHMTASMMHDLMSEYQVSIDDNGWEMS